MALLLHTGGIDLQDLFYSLVPEAEDNEITYEHCVQRLNDHFIPQVNITFERHMFKQLQQLPNETVDQFVARLRQKAASCGFANVEEAIRDQVIETGSSNHLRRKFLEKSGNIAPNEMQRIARAFEAVDLQMRSMEQEGNQERPNDDTEEVNAVDIKINWKGKRGDIGRGYESRVQSNHDFKCYRCNQSGNFARDLMCPARDEICKHCGRRGHYVVCCKTQGAGNSKPKRTTKDKAYNVCGSGDEYAFTIESDRNPSGLVNLIVGCVTMTSVVIESGASCNVMDKATWDTLKQSRVKCTSQSTGKKLFAHEQDKPIEVIGTFVSEIECEANDNTCFGEFMVIKGVGKTLLGRSTAARLDVFRVGPFGNTMLTLSQRRAWMLL